MGIMGIMGIMNIAMQHIILITPIIPITISDIAAGHKGASHARNLSNP